jgi:hypothetical protein
MLHNGAYCMSVSVESLLITSATILIIERSTCLAALRLALIICLSALSFFIKMAITVVITAHNLRLDNIHTAYDSLYCCMDSIPRLLLNTIANYHMPIVAGLVVFTRLVRLATPEVMLLAIPFVYAFSFCAVIGLPICGFVPAVLVDSAFFMLVYSMFRHSQNVAALQPVRESVDSCFSFLPCWLAERVFAIVSALSLWLWMMSIHKYGLAVCFNCNLLDLVISRYIAWHLDTYFQLQSMWTQVGYRFAS